LLSGALVTLVLAVACAAPVRGASTGASRNVTVALVSEEVSVQPGRPFVVGLHMRMRAGWHTYWKNPGDAGLPLRIKWSLPEGFLAGPIQWPVPERLPDGPVMSYGYEGDVLLPVQMTPPSLIGTGSVTIAGTFEWLECKDVCLPGSAVLDITIPVLAGAPRPSRAAALFTETRSRMPQSPADRSFSAEAGPRAISLAVRVPAGFSSKGAYFFPDQPLVADFAAPQGFERFPGGCRITMTPDPNAKRTPERLSGVLVFDERAGTRPRTALSVDVPVIAGDPAPAPKQSERRALPKALYVAIIVVLGVGLALLWRFARRSHST